MQHPSSATGPEAAMSGYQLVYRTGLGQLYQGDCVPFLAQLPESCLDMVFADPPFNLGKDYGAGISDDRQAEEYLAWSRQWLADCVRVLKPGGSLFVFNLPRWLIEYGAFLNQQGMLFRHWIACRMPKAFPRGQRLSPAHYGLLYYTKGAPAVFNKIYVPIPVCRHCGGEIRDYGGHRNKLNAQGLNLMDVLDAPEEVWESAGLEDSNVSRLWTPAEDLWDDIPPVRHSKYKTRGANELAPIMLERLIALATNPGDRVLDPFGGSGTTFYAAEKLGRCWIGIEIGDTSAAISRLTDLGNGHFVEWESVRGESKRNGSQQLRFFEPAPAYERPSED